jgi:hypothetical protein
MEVGFYAKILYKFSLPESKTHQCLSWLFRSIKSKWGWIKYGPTQDVAQLVRIFANRSKNWFHHVKSIGLNGSQNALSPLANKLQNLCYISQCSKIAQKDLLQLKTISLSIQPFFKKHNKYEWSKNTIKMDPWILDDSHAKVHHPYAEGEEADVKGRLKH